MAKLTDENNLEQPQLPFQRKAISAYCEQQIHDAASKNKPSVVSNTTESDTISKDHAA
ncbi:hypothetical protein C0992_010556, partial [Termitomyces sp. T32_za158]